MKVRQAAERLEVSPGTVYGLVAAGRLKCTRIGLKRGCIRISEQQVAEFLAGAEPIKPASAPARRITLRHL